jgi:rod shape-determining protein MreB
LANDLLTRGLYLAGGGALLDGFARRLATAAGIPIHLVVSPETVTAHGAARSLRAMRSGSSALSLGAPVGSPGVTPAAAVMPEPD